MGVSFVVRPQLDHDAEPQRTGVSVHGRALLCNAGGM